MLQFVLSRVPATATLLSRLGILCSCLPFTLAKALV